MSTIIACGCENYAHPDRMQCGATTAIGTPMPCSCDCHTAALARVDARLRADDDREPPADWPPVEIGGEG